MKYIRIDDSKEIWPVHFIEETSNRKYGFVDIQVSEETYNRWKKAQKDFDQMQREIAELIGSGTYEIY